jgi:hypothetical protein
MHSGICYIELENTVNKGAWPAQGFFSIPLRFLITLWRNGIPAIAMPKGKTYAIKINCRI